MRNPEIVNETLVSAKQGGKLAQVGNRGPSANTLVRWFKSGAKDRQNPEGPKITLEHCYLGGRLYTSVEAFRRWLKRTNRA